VDHVNIYQLVLCSTVEFLEAVRPWPTAPGDRWVVDETYLNVDDHWAHLYRAIDQHGKSSTNSYAPGATWLCTGVLQRDAKRRQSPRGGHRRPGTGLRSGSRTR